MRCVRLILFHGVLHGRNGQAGRTFDSEQIAVHTPVALQMRDEMFFWSRSGCELVAVGDAGFCLELNS